LKNAQDEFNRYAQLHKEGAVSGSIFDAREMALKVAKEEYNNALERLNEFEKGPENSRSGRPGTAWRGLNGSSKGSNSILSIPC